MGFLAMLMLVAALGYYYGFYIGEKSTRAEYSQHVQNLIGLIHSQKSVVTGLQEQVKNTVKEKHGIDIHFEGFEEQSLPTSPPKLRLVENTSA